MRLSIKRVCILFLFFLTSASIAAFDATQLIKVTKDNNPNCVEYFNYQGELYCNTHASKASPVAASILADEKQQIVFDNRPWQAAWAKKTEQMTTIEYIPAGESINDWHELITSQYIPGLQDKVTPIAFAEYIMKKLKTSGFNPTINIIDNTNNQVIFEFQISSPANLRQDELQKISKGANGMYILHYVIKTADMGEKNRKRWIANFQKSHISNGGT